MEEIGSDEFPGFFFMETAERAVDKSEQAIRFEAADQIRLVFHHRPESFLTFRHRVFGRAAFGRGRRQQHIGDCQNSDVTAHQHQAVFLRAGRERPFTVKK